jgi:hypothetical protein
MPRRRYTDEALSRAVAQSRTMREVLMSLGLSPRGGNYETVWRRIAALGIDSSHFRSRGRPVRSCSDEEIAEAVRGARSFAEVMARLGLRPGSSRVGSKRRVQEIRLDTSHFLGQSWRKGIVIPATPARPLTELLVSGRPTQSNRLKVRLIHAGLKAARCEQCERTSWNGRPIPLELDHINGRRDDNRLTNLRVLCPNCHAQTSTYRGRNKGKSEAVSWVDARVAKSGESRHA